MSWLANQSPAKMVFANSQGKRKRRDSMSPAAGYRVAVKRLFARNDSNLVFALDDLTAIGASTQEHIAVLEGFGVKVLSRNLQHQVDQPVFVHNCKKQTYDKPLS